MLKQKLALLIWSIDPDSSQSKNIATPLIHALCALAMEVEVEIHFAGEAVRFLTLNTAETIRLESIKAESPSSFLTLLSDLQKQGAKILACAMAHHAHLSSTEPLLPFVGISGATAFVQRSLDPQWTTLIY